MRAAARVLRQQPGVGQDLVEVFGDRQRVPDLDAVMGEAGHQERGRQQQQLGAGGGVVAPTVCSAKSSPAILHNSQPRSDQEP